MTEPPPVMTFEAYANQWIINDALNEDFERQVRWMFLYPPPASTGLFLLFLHSSLLKKLLLDKEILSNYRLVSNVSFISKLPECIVLSRINDCLTSTHLLPD